MRLQNHIFEIRLVLIHDFICYNQRSHVCAKQSNLYFDYFIKLLFVLVVPLLHTICQL